ncbi:response regulator [Candidatus Solirubrobacter pratensis]|uniref:response regulator n=1 Tax=Candidatus Solirubrobacter pratensis TaxID=1298857 RepID=UPI00042A2948|nr:response regulator transcription factor [Candidatus Solirubrobacter pratensis]
MLIVDDHDLFRSGLRLLLEHQGFEVADADSGEAALCRLRTFPADVVLMDVDMPGISGIAATRQVLAHDPRTVVVMLSALSDDAQVLEALVAGASGYLLKDAQMPDIVAGIEATLAGESPIAPRVAAGLVERLRSSTRAQPPAPAPVLSERERQVLDLLAQGWDNAEIAQRLQISSSTVKNHVSRLMEKLSVRNRVQAAVYAAQEGLVDGDRSLSG